MEIVTTTTTYTQRVIVCHLDQLPNCNLNDLWVPATLTFIAVVITLCGAWGFVRWVNSLNHTGES